MEEVCVWQLLQVAELKHARQAAAWNLHKTAATAETHASAAE
jgi:hypothetical protein